MARKLLKITVIALITCLIIVVLPIVPRITEMAKGEQPLIPTSILAQINETQKAEADRLLEQGIQQFQNNQFQAAVQSLQQALDIYRQIKDKLGEGRSLANIGLSYLYLGEYQKTLEYNQQALMIFKELKDRNREAIALTNIGNAYTSLGQYQKAIESLQQHLAIKREIGDKQGEANALNNLGNAYTSLRQYQKAIKSFEQSLAIKREIGDRNGEANSLNSLGLAYYSLGQYQKAIEYHQQSLTIAREISDRSAEGSILGNLGIAYSSLGQYQKAIEYYQQQLAITREIGDIQGEGNSLNNLGSAYINLKQYTEATQFLSEAIEVFESLRVDLPDAAKISIFDTQTAAYRNIQKALIVQNKTQQALEIAERGRARAFVELLASKTTNKVLKPITLTEIQQIAKEENATLVEYSIVSDALYIWVIKPSGEITFKQTQFPSNLPLTALVETGREAIGVSRGGLGVRERSYVPGDLVKLKDDAENGFQKPWRVIKYDAVTNKILTLTYPDFDGEATVTRPSSDVAEKVKEAHISQKPLQDLYKVLITPITDQLPTNPDENIIFIPHGELFLVPFVALQDEQGNYLIEKHTILTAPAIQILQLTHANGTAGTAIPQLSPNNALIVGNPTMPTIPLTDPPERLIPLPNAEREAKMHREADLCEIAQLLNTTPILGKEATKANILPKMPTASLIHLATHGLLDDIKQLGTPGAIALTPTADDDGFLNAGEIINMKLKADLVVLSACNTGQGNLTGDGVVGLSRSLMTAGASSVIVSLWSVPDAPTADLMTQFYQNRQKMNKAQALRQAMLTTLKQHPEPKNWAAFTLLGETE